MNTYFLLTKFYKASHTLLSELISGTSCVGEKKLLYSLSSIALQRPLLQSGVLLFQLATQHHSQLGGGVG